jgi:hypothetical protein
MKLLKKIGKKILNKQVEVKNHPEDILIERKESETALAEIELRDR